MEEHFPRVGSLHKISRFPSKKLFCTLYSPPHPSPRNGFEEKLPRTAPYILPHTAPQSWDVELTHLWGYCAQSSGTPTYTWVLVKIYFQIARCALCSRLTFAGLCSREHIKSQQGLRLRLAGLSRYPPTLKRSKDETVAQRRLHIVIPLYVLSRGRLCKRRRATREDGLTGLLGLD